MMRYKFLHACLVLLLLCGFFASTLIASDTAEKKGRDPLLGDLTDAEIFTLGERMYRDGILPSGEMMEAFGPGDLRIDSRAFSCSHCHQRAGLGSVEGGVVTPPAVGIKLYQPYQRPPSLNDVIDVNGRYSYAKTISRRPAYTRDSLKHALRTGEDPVGETFNGIMPRYPLDDRDLAIMVRYLELLSAEPSPGATATGFKFATIVTDDVSAEDREAMLVPIKRFIAGQNKQVSMYRDFLKFNYKPTGDMKYAFRTASLQVWELKGDPQTWREQLANYYQREPVFAVLGGISNQSWQPIHDFCEEMQLPCFYPVTNLPVVTDQSWYNHYFNKGYYQEGAAVANFLKKQGDSELPILQIIQDTAEGQALAAGFKARFKPRNKKLETLVLDTTQIQDQKSILRALKQHKPEILLLWGDEAILPELQRLASSETSIRIFVSSSALGAATLQIPDSLREQVFITYPYRLTPYLGNDEALGLRSPRALETTYKNLADRRIASRTAIMLNQSVIQGLRLLYQNLLRDYMIDVMSMQMDQVIPDYERLSFGPGQRYASKGCYVIQLGQGPEPEIIPRSEWVIR